MPARGWPDAALSPKTYMAAGGPKDGVVLYPIIPLTRRLQEPIEIGPADEARPGEVSMGDLRRDLRNLVEKVVKKLVEVDFRNETEEMGMILGALARTGARRFGTQVAFRRAEKVIGDALGRLRADFR